MTLRADSSTASPGPLVPTLHRVMERRLEASDVVTLSLAPLNGAPMPFRGGQFNMLTAFGVGEAAISISSRPEPSVPLEHTVRDVGAVTHALCTASVGTVVGVRGPFGTDWGAEGLARHLAWQDVVVVAGGIGIAPLRAAVSSLVERLGTARAQTAREQHASKPQSGRVIVLIGARSPDQVIFTDVLEGWRRAGAEVQVIVDVADQGWTGPVGVVTTLVASEELDPARTTALLCGPEIMMRFTARALLAKGIDPQRILISLERNMQCGVGLCGHCQLGPLLLCRDGPVVAYSAAVSQLLLERER